MNGDRLIRIEFESRIFISFGIVILTVLLAYFVFPALPSTVVLFGSLFGFTPRCSTIAGYLLASGIMALSSAVRMWAGSVLTSDRMMSFKVRKDALLSSGPYMLVRNPIYLADLCAFCGFALVLSPVALLMPVLLYFHYTQLVKYEEENLKLEFSDNFEVYRSSAPRFFPNLTSIRRIPKMLRHFSINRDGFRNNSLYLL